MAYSLATHFAGHALLDRFSFFTGDDPTRGFVDYQSREQARARNLVSVDESNRVRLGVDSMNTYSPRDRGRPSVRLTSDDAFTHGLFIADFAHMPGSICGTWPTFWAFNNQENGSLWPMGGELDIIEGANTAQRNLFSSHTTSGCQAPRSGFAGVQGPTDCSTNPDNIGCNFAAPISDTNTYGDAFNAEGGGVYAVEWDSNDIKIWHFPRSGIPDDIKLAPMVDPEPSTWGPPQAMFGGAMCRPNSYFFNMSLVINTNFCGVYAGNIWGASDECSKLAPTCEEYVAKNPRVFSNAFWEINYIDVYQRPAVALNHSLSHFSQKSPVMSNPPSSSPTGETVIPSGTRTITVSTVITQVISTAAPTRTGGGLADPDTINGWTLLGCFGSPAGDSPFARRVSSQTMDTKACVAACAERKYAGVSGETCYCADNLGDATAVANDMCNVLCPGNTQELCGGASGKPSLSGIGIALVNSTSCRNASSDTLSSTSLNAPNLRSAQSTILTVYCKSDDAMPPGSPGMGMVMKSDMPKAGTAAVGTGLSSAAQPAVPGAVPTHAASWVPVTGAGTLSAMRTAGFSKAVAYGLIFWFAVGIIL